MDLLMSTPTFLARMNLSRAREMTSRTESNCPLCTFSLARMSAWSASMYFLSLRAAWAWSSSSWGIVASSLTLFSFLMPSLTSLEVSWNFDEMMFSPSPMHLFA